LAGDAVILAAIDLRARRPRYLTEADHPWLEALLELYRAHHDVRRGTLDEALASFAAGRAYASRIDRAARVLDRIVATRVRSEVDPREIRARLFGARGSHEPRAATLARVARELDLRPLDVEDLLFADFPRERRVDASSLEFGASELAIRTNEALVRALVGRSTHVRVEAKSRARDLVRHARLVGLMCSVERSGEHGELVVDFSGPLALFRSTRLYAGALASIVPRVAWCEDFVLGASLQAGDGTVDVLVRSGDPIRPSKRPATFDSALEERFARAFAREVRDFELLREPCAIEVAGQFIFPDFAIVDRADPSRKFVLEIVGFHTPDYLARKLTLYRAASIDLLVLCIDAARGVGAEDVPPRARVVRFRRSIRVSEVMAAIRSS